MNASLVSEAFSCCENVVQNTPGKGTGIVFENSTVFIPI